MRKVIFIISIVMMTICSVQTFGQGKWEISNVEGDELKGTVSGTAYDYTVPGVGSFIFWGFDEYQFRLVSDEMFNTEVVGGISGVNINVGLYNSDGKLIDKFKMWLDNEDNKKFRFVRTRDQGTMFNPCGQKGKVKKIFSHLKKNNGGYVRIVAERYHMSEFDLKITQL